MPNNQVKIWFLASIIKWEFSFIGPNYILLQKLFENIALVKQDITIRSWTPEIARALPFWLETIRIN